MLPRKISPRVSTFWVVALLAGFLVQPTAQGYVRVPPKVAIQDFLPQQHIATKAGDKFVFQVLDKCVPTQFSLVGVTWQGKLPLGTEIQVKAREKSGWSPWAKLSYSPEHGPDAKTIEGAASRNGTDPLITTDSDCVQVQLKSNVAKLPKDLKISLIDSATMNDDVNAFMDAKRSVSIRNSFGAVITKTGAVVNRPNIVTRAQWGADESWRDKSPRISNKIIAGFIHHTATTNSYNPEDGPAQMRSLYAYFTKSLQYADMGYNFLVDRYGVVYEGRAGCPPTAGLDCDGPARAVIGAHTAGMNDNTFAISAIGNFHTGAIEKETANLMTNAIAELMAWKIAPFNLDPSAMAQIPSTDTSGLSKYRKGTTATVPVISAHLDVGRTVCPGKFLYPLIPEIRSKIAGILTSRIEDVMVSPIDQLATDPNPISLSAKLPVSGNWNVTVVSADSGSVVYTQSGTLKGNSNFKHKWDHTDASGQLVPAGNYAVSLSATVAEKLLPTETTMITLVSEPARISGAKIKRISGSTVLVTWPVQANSVPLVDAIFYRTSWNKGQTWTTWKQLPETASEQMISSKTIKKRILIELKQTNAIGDSTPVQMSFVTKSR